MREVLVNRLGLTDRPDITLDVYRGRKTTMAICFGSHLNSLLCSSNRFSALTVIIIMVIAELQYPNLFLGTILFTSQSEVQTFQW